jgi:hypothetical protein
MMRKVYYSIIKFVLWILPVPFILIVARTDTAAIFSITRSPFNWWEIGLLLLAFFFTVALIYYIYTLVHSFRLLRVFERREGYGEGSILLEKMKKSILFYTVNMTLTLPLLFIFSRYRETWPPVLFILLTFSGIVFYSFASILQEVISEKNMKEK